MARFAQKTDYFLKSHLSTSAAALAVLTREWMDGKPSWCTVFELEGEIDIESSHDHHYNHHTKFNFRQNIIIEGSANGMLFLHKYDNGVEALYVCNPISREYIELHCPEKDFIRRGDIYGFGASRISGQYKVVRIKGKSNCHVYTLGTGSWRRVEPPSASFSYDCTASSTVVNGNLHRIAYSNGTFCISCFDLETLCFSTFLIPPFQGIMTTSYDNLSVLRDCLCYCDNTSQEGHVVIWLMKEYGDEKSWTREYVINLNPDFHGRGFVYPVKVFKDGDVLMVLGVVLLYYYSNKTKTIQKIGVFNGGNNKNMDSMLLTPSFLSLKSFPMENVSSL